MGGEDKTLTIYIHQILMQLSTWNLYKDEATAPRKQRQSQNHGTDSLKNLYHQNVVEMVDLIRHHDIYVCVV